MEPEEVSGLQVVIGYWLATGAFDGFGFMPLPYPLARLCRDHRPDAIEPRGPSRP
jgi:hypothetical protein